MDLRVGAPGDHHVGPAAGDDPRRLGDRQVRRRVGLGDRVARPLAVDQDRDVAGQHVGQVLQEPDRLDHPDRFAAPDLEVERLARCRRRARSPVPARRARWRSSRRPGRCRSGSDRRRRRPARHPTTASCAAATASWMSRARYFLLLRRAFQILGQRVFLQIEVADLGTDVVGKAGDPEGLERTHRPPALGQATSKRGPDYHPGVSPGPDRL